MADAKSSGPLLEKLPAELKNSRLTALSAKVQAMLQLLIDADIQAGGEVTSGTMEAIAAQGYVYLDGSLRKLDTLTQLQKKAVEIAKRYETLPVSEKIGMIAQTFGCTSGKIETSPCRGKWRGTSDVSIRFDSGASLFIGNVPTMQARTAKVRNRLVNSAFLRYNPEIVAAAKETALAALRAREVHDNAIAAQKGLKPYTLLNVEIHDGADDGYGGYMGWYYVTLAVDGTIHAHLETGLNFDIAQGQVSETPSRDRYFTAGALKETEIDYVFDNVGFSSASTLYSLPIRSDVLERAEKSLAERKKVRAAVPARSNAPHRKPACRKPRRDGLER